MIDDHRLRVSKNLNPLRVRMGTTKLVDKMSIKSTYPHLTFG